MHLTDLTWPDIAALDKDTPVVFPIAALEQHGWHMPLFTDSMLMGEIARRAELELKKEVLFVPLQWLGNSHHHLDFPGTLSAAPRVYLDLLVGLLENFIAHGFRRLILLNGHGGNDVPGKQAVFEVRQRHRLRDDLLLLFGTYWSLSPEAGAAHPELTQKVMGHACEWETSMVLRLAPHLVKAPETVTEVPFGNSFEPATRGWIMTDRSVPGHVGNPTQATSEKGEALFQVFTRDVVAMLWRVIDWNGKSWDG